jgi:hypothetical protein
VLVVLVGSKHISNKIPGALIAVIGAIAVSYLIAWLFAPKIRQFLDKDIEKARAHMRYILSPAHFATMLNYLFLAVAGMVLSGSFQRVYRTGWPPAHDFQTYSCTAGHSPCIILHQERFAVGYQEQPIMAF